MVVVVLVLNCYLQADHPHGNPYSGCVVCLYDNQCGPGQECQEERCVVAGGEGEHPVPPDYVQVGGEHYYISDKPLSWSLAQYSCMNKEGEQNLSEQSIHFPAPGHLIELPTTEKLTRLQRFLLTRATNRTFWLGASDLESEGIFRWFYDGAELSRDMWSPGEPGRSDTEENCVQLDQTLVRFSDADCETERWAGDIDPD